MINWLVVSISHRNFPSQQHGMMDPKRCHWDGLKLPTNLQLTFGQLWRHTAPGSQEPCWATVQFHLETQLYSEPWCGRCGFPWEALYLCCKRQKGSAGQFFSWNLQVFLMSPFFLPAKSPICTWIVKWHLHFPSILLVKPLICGWNLQYSMKFSGELRLGRISN